MGTFMQTFERVAVKYAEYVEAKLVLSSSIKEIKPGQEFFFGKPEEAAKQFVIAMQTLNQIAKTITEQQQNTIGESDSFIIETEEIEEMTSEKLAELKEKMLYTIGKNEETGAIEICPLNDEKCIILHDAWEVEWFIKELIETIQL